MTLPLAGCAAVAVWRTRRAAFAGLAWVGIYLGLCLVQKHRAETALDAIIAARGHHPERINVKPSFGNIVLWRGIYQEEGTYYAVAIRPGWPGDVKVKAGEMAAVLPGPAGDGSPWEGIPGDSTLVLDAARFYHFSGNWVGWHPDFPGTVLGDLRYARLPGEFSPMWGIGFDRTDPDRHVPWMTFRTLSRESLAPLWEMICSRGF